MWNKMRIVLISSVLLTAPVWGDDGQSSTTAIGPFDGEWALTVTPDSAAASDGQDSFSEAVLFHNGEFSAAAFAMFGFSPAGYTIAEDDGTYVFTAVLTSSDRGTLTWSGRGSSGGIAGSMLWARPDGVTYRYELLGTRPETN